MHHPLWYATVVWLTLLTACGGGGQFDVVVVLDSAGSHAVVVGNTSAIVSEFKRASGDSAHPLPQMGVALKTVATSAGSCVVSADGRFATVQKAVGDQIDVVSTIDGAVKKSFKPQKSANVVALADGGGRMAITDGTGPFTLHVVELDGAKVVDAGSVTNFGAAFAGQVLYISDATGLFRVESDGKRTPVTGVTTVTELVGEPLGNRVWGIAPGTSGGAVFHVDGGGTVATLGTGSLADYAKQLSVAPGGRLAFVAHSALIVTGTDGSNAHAAKGFSSGLSLPTFAVSPDTSAVVYSSPDTSLGVAIGWQLTESSGDGASASVLTDGSVPSRIQARN